MRKIYGFGLAFIIVSVIILYVYSLVDDENYITIKVDEKKQKVFNVNYIFVYKKDKQISFFSRLKYPLIYFQKVKFLLEISSSKESIKEAKYIINASNSTGVFMTSSIYPNPNAYNLEGYVIITEKKGEKISGHYELVYDKITPVSKKSPNKIQVFGKFNDVQLE